MATLFDVRENNITYHLQNIFDSNELDKNSVTQKIRVTASDGKKYLTGFYNLDAIIAVGYRVNSKKATKFRIWATDVLKDYIIKGFKIDKERMKNARDNHIKWELENGSDPYEDWGKDKGVYPKE